MGKSCLGDVPVIHKSELFSAYELVGDHVVWYITAWYGILVEQRGIAVRFPAG